MARKQPKRRYHDLRGDGGRFAPRPAEVTAGPNPAGTGLAMGTDQQAALAGATPGWWISDHLAELRHFVSWIYVGVHKIAQQWAQAKVCVYDGSMQTDAYEQAAKHWGPRVVAMAKKMRRLRTKSNVPDMFAEQEEPLPDHPAAKLLDRPNPLTSGLMFRYQTACQIGLTGGAYVWEVPNQFGEPEHLWMLPRGWVRPMAPSGQYPLGYYQVTPVMNTFSQGIISPYTTTWNVPFEQMVAMGWSNPLYPGEFTSPLAACSRIIDIMEQTDTATWSTFINAVKPSLVFNIDPRGPGGVPKETMDLFIKELEAFKSGANNHGKILAMLGLTVQQLMAGPSELDYVNGRKQLQEQVLSIQGTPPVMIGQPVGNYSEAAVQAKAAVEFAVQPGLNLFAETFTHRWQPIWGDDFRIEATAKAMDDPTLLLQKADKVAAAYTAGVVSANEYRASIDQPPLDDPVADIPKCLLDELMPQEGAGEEEDPYASFEDQNSVDPYAMIDNADDMADETSTGIKNPTQQEAPGRDFAKRLGDLSTLMSKADTFDESKHRRGQPENAGQFGSGGSGSGGGGSDNRAVAQRGTPPPVVQHHHGHVAPPTEQEQKVVDELTYRSYAAQRQHDPTVSPERWGKLFPEWKEMERRFQEDVQKWIEKLEAKVDAGEASARDKKALANLIKHYGRRISTDAEVKAYSFRTNGYHTNGVY